LDPFQKREYVPPEKIVRGLVISDVPVTVTERLDAVVFARFQNPPLSLEPRVGTVNALNPVLVIRQTPAELEEVNVSDVAVDTSVTIALYSVGDIRRMLFEETNWRLYPASTEVVAY
jgi:hypothetical protein